jgi:hypothetical protein
MHVLFWILFFASLFTLTLGLAKPNLFKRENGQPVTRNELTAICGVLMFIFFILAVATSSTKSQGNTDQNNASQQPTAIIKATSKATPTPTDPCHDYVGTQYSNCMELQEAAKRGEALSHPLKATITHDDYAVYIKNNETTEWDQCTLIVNEADTVKSGDNFQPDGFVVETGQTVTIRWANFTNAESQRFDYVHVKPNSLDLDCIVGGHTNKNGAFSGGQEHRSTFNL